MKALTYDELEVRYKELIHIGGMVVNDMLNIDVLLLKIQCSMNGVRYKVIEDEVNGYKGIKYIEITK